MYPIYRIINAILLVSFAVTFVYCTAAEQVTRREPGEGTPEKADSAAVSGDYLDLDRYRSTLSDQFVTLQHDLPEVFQQSYKGDQNVERDPFDGFRIQILSSINVSIADSTARDFRVWADTTLAGYMPRAYVFFKQPYYKVHVGDFHDRERAIQFSVLVKRQFPDAWVVHDRINPYLVPADTVKIELKKSTKQRTSTDEE